MRRVVTGIDESGRSVVVSDGPIVPAVPPTLRGVENFCAWATDVLPVVPTDGSDPAGGERLRYVPVSRGAVRFNICTIPADADVLPEPADAAEAAAETERLLPGMNDFVSGSDAMHFTPTVDLQYIIDGEIVLELGDGSETVLRAGDVLVQNGANHSWRNASSASVTFLIVMLGTEMDRSLHTPS
jgi:uncharacterized cupin superfamily protein